MSLPSHARVVIIGGGIAGCSVAYHLARLGWRDLVLLERKRLTSGTTWHAAGLIGQLRATANMTRLARYSAELYGRLEDETGVANAVVWQKTFERFRPVVMGARLVRVTGRLQSVSGVIHVVADRIDDISLRLEALSEGWRQDDFRAPADEAGRPMAGDPRGDRAEDGESAIESPMGTGRAPARGDRVDKVMPKGRNFH